MAYNEELAQRIREGIKGVSDITEKKMFGGLCFLYKGKMTVGIVKDDLCGRVLSGQFEEVLAEPHVREMDFTKKSMKEFIYVSPPGFETEEQLQRWIELGVEHAKSKL